MATERAHESDHAGKHAGIDTYIEEKTRANPQFLRLLAQARERARHEGTYRLGPADLEEFIALGADGQRQLIETPGALEDWLATHAAHYA